jgi:tripartite-type tricarboxylate transporter receptor subunit TctC
MVSLRCVASWLSILPNRVMVLAAIVTGMFAGRAIGAEAYPVKPVRIIVASGAGGGDDIMTRLVATKLSDQLGKQFITENRPGAGGMIGQTVVAKSLPDGYTLLLGGGSMAGARYVNAAVTYDVLRDFSPISLVAISPYFLLVHPSVPARNVKEYIELARSRPGKMTFGTPGAGQTPYWSVMLFNSMARINAVEIQYKTGSSAVVDLMAGQIDYYFAPLNAVVSNGPKLRALEGDSEGDRVK